MKKFFYIFAIVVFVVGFNIQGAHGVGESGIIDFLEEFRKRMCHPIPKLGLPALDPFEIKHIEYEMNNKYLIDFTGSLTNFKLTGLSDFVINDLKIYGVPLRRSIFNISMPLTSFKSLYTAKGSLAYILNLAGDGDAYAAVEHVNVAVSWILKTSNYLGIRDLKLTITIKNIEIDFENLMEDERINDFFHALVNELGLELLNDIWQIENKLVETLVEQKINNFIGQYTIADIIKLVAGGGDEPIFGPNDPPGDCKDDAPKQFAKMKL